MNVTIKHEKHRWNGVLAFLGLTFALSWGIEIGLRPLGVPFVIRAVLGMYGPAIAAFLVRGPLCREGFADAGLRPLFRSGAGRWYVIAFVSVPLCFAVGAALALALHVQRIDPLENLVALASRLGVSPKPGELERALSPSVLGPGIIAACSVAPFINAIVAFGEEFGWRGYLLPRLIARLGTFPAILVVGCIWGLWHAPLILLDGLNYPTHRWPGVGMMVLYCVVMSVFFGALRLRSNSIWPAALAHGAVNAQATVVTLLLAPSEGFMNAPLGFIGALPFLIAGMWLFETQRGRARAFRYGL